MLGSKEVHLDTCTCEPFHRRIGSTWKRNIRKKDRNLERIVYLLLTVTLVRIEAPRIHTDVDCEMSKIKKGSLNHIVSVMEHDGNILLPTTCHSCFLALLGVARKPPASIVVALHQGGEGGLPPDQGL